MSTESELEDGDWFSWSLASCQGIRILVFLILNWFSKVVVLTNAIISGFHNLDILFIKNEIITYYLSTYDLLR